MMNTTHVAIAASLAATTVVIAPEQATAAAAGAIVGAALPDLDILLGEHRRSLHFPVLGWVPTVPAVALAVLRPTPVTVAGAFFLLGFALHASMDVLGGGPERRPWIGRSQRAVYHHLDGRWLPARRWVRYDGAPEDFALGLFAAVPALLTFDGPVRGVLLAGLAVSLVYATFRKRIPDLTDRLCG